MRCRALTTASVAAFVAAMVVWAAPAAGDAALEYFWTGLGADTSVWNDENNWTLGLGGPVSGYPDSKAERANIMIAATITSGLPAKLNGIITGDGAVALDVVTSHLQFYESDSPNKTKVLIAVGTGGLDFGPTAWIKPELPVTMTVAGELKALKTDFRHALTSLTTTGAGILRIPTFGCGLVGATQIKDWAFGEETESVSMSSSTAGGNVTFVGQPTFENDKRADWTVRGRTDKYMDLNGYDLWGDTLTITGVSASTHPEYYACLTNTSGSLSTVDVNEVVIGDGGQLNAYLDVPDTDVFVRGSGLSWENRSVNRTAFKMDHAMGTTVTFDPGASPGSSSMDTGSEDRGPGAGGFVDNFAFDLIQIGEGDEITLVGDNNTGYWDDVGGQFVPGDGLLNALYARTIEGLGAGGTLLTNGHNVYLLEMPVNVIFDTSGGGDVYVNGQLYGAEEEIPEPATMLLVAAGGATMLLRRRRRRR